MTGHDLQQLAEKLGLQAFAYRGSMDDLRQNLARRPARDRDAANAAGAAGWLAWRRDAEPVE